MCSTSDDCSLLGACRAGDGDRSGLQPRQAAYIRTGAPLPSGADAVVQVEDAEDLTGTAPAEGARVRLVRPIVAGQEVRPVGSDIAEGTVVLRVGDRAGAEAGVELMKALTASRREARPGWECHHQ